MSIRPATIDRTGQQPCLPTGALLAVCERLAQGHAPTLRERVVKCLGNLRRRLSQ
jgi:hypothetical protein